MATIQWHPRNDEVWVVSDDGFVESKKRFMSDHTRDFMKTLQPSALDDFSVHGCMAEFF